jgi:hypothetical protein
MKHALASALLLAPVLAWATPPDACTILTMDEINSVAGAGAAEKVQPVKAGNPTECNFVDAKKAAVLSIKMREVQYAAKDELGQERESLEKIYHAKAKELTAIGEKSYWMGPVHQLLFYKGHTLVFVTFQQPKNQNEVASAQIARMIESKLK